MNSANKPLETRCRSNLLGGWKIGYFESAFRSEGANDTQPIIESSMTHLPPLIYDLSVILASAAISTLLFRRLKQPIVLGYLIAGFVVGPHFRSWPTVADTEGVKLWAEIGVIFLLFGLGLEFSFKKLAKVGKSASTAAVFEILTMSGVGYLFGRAIGWNTMDSIYLGAILSMSSTTIIIRAFEEAGLKGKGFANLVFGILIVEDLIAILIMVLLAALSVPGAFSSSSLVYLSARLGFFLLSWFLVGIYLLPSVLKKLRTLLSDEILLVVSIGLCLGMVVLATQAGFSAALGAFIMGSILAETQEGERIEHLLRSVKNLFAAVFFVSVGMMIDPRTLSEHAGIILLITLITIVGKFLGSGFGALISGRSLRHSVQAGMSLAQIGEFSFILATLGLTLKVTSDFLYPIIIAVSAVTTFTTPYLIQFSDPFYSWLEKKLPKTLLDRLSRYELAMSVDSKESALGLLWRVYGLSVLLNSVVLVAIALTSGAFFLPFFNQVFGDEPVVNACACLLTLLACSPFLLAIVRRPPKNLSTEDSLTLARLRSLQIGVWFLRNFLGLFLSALIIDQFTPTIFLSLAILVAVPVILFLLRTFIVPVHSSIENRFLENLNAKELADLEKVLKQPELAPWEATLSQFTLSSDSAVAGLTLEETKFRSLTGATVAMVDRGRQRIFAPSRSERLLPSDAIYLVGTDEQLTAAKQLLEAERAAPPPEHDKMYSLQPVSIADGSLYAGKSIREIAVGATDGVLIMGIEREGKRILNPEPSQVLRPQDLVWVFGHQDRIRDLKKREQENR